jgi:hypothetical protein
MALNHIVITALRDAVFIETKRAKVPFSVATGSQLPSGQKAEDESVQGITLRIDQQVEIDVSDRQLAAFQAAAAAGDIELSGVPAQILHQVTAPSIPVPAVDADQGYTNKSSKK